MNCQHNTRHGSGDSCLTSHSISHITNMATTVRVGLGCELSRQSLRGFSRTVRHDTFYPPRTLSRMGGQCQVLLPAAAVFPSWCQMTMERCLGWRWRLQNPASTPPSSPTWQLTGSGSSQFQSLKCQASCSTDKTPAKLSLSHTGKVYKHQMSGQVTFPCVTVCWNKVFSYFTGIVPLFSASRLDIYQQWNKKIWR